MEGFLLYPLNALSTEYFVASATPYPDRNLYFSQFLIAGTEGNTRVIVEFPKTFTPWSNGSFEIELQKFQTFMFTSGSDTTGTRIVSDKPVAVFSGDSLGEIVSGKVGYMVEQMLPTKYYDYQYIVPGFVSDDTYVVRMFALYDNTEVNIYNSSSHDSHFLNRDDPIERVFRDEPTIIISDSPVYLMTYSPKPFMVAAQAMAQFQSEYEFVLQESNNRLAITIKTEEFPNLYIDGGKAMYTSGVVNKSLTAPFKDYTVFHIPLEGSTIHRVHHATGRRFGAILYGISTYAYGMNLQQTLTDIG